MELKVVSCQEKIVLNAAQLLIDFDLNVKLLPLVILLPKNSCVS